MLTATLLLTLASGDLQTAFLTEGPPRTIRLTATPLPDYSGWTVQQLRAEYVRLDELRPGVALPVTLLQVGITGLTVTLVALAIGLGQCCRGPSPGVFIGTGLGLTTSVASISIAGILLWRAYPERGIYSAQMDEVERLANQDERDERLLQKWEQKYGPGRPPGTPAPGQAAPPIPPQVSVQVPLLFAQF